MPGLILHAPPSAAAALMGVTALAVSFVFTPIVRSLAVRVGLISRPVQDRWGRRVIARLGGAAMFLAFISAALIWTPWQEPPVPGLLIGITLVFALGLVDDLRRMPPYTKLIGQLLIGCVVVLLGLRFELGPWNWLAIPLSVLWFVLVMNAFNLLDNMDGLAAGVGAIAAACCAFHAVLTGQWTVAGLAAAVCGACLGFLHFNFPPAKIYMGDSGSHFLGFSLAALTPMIRGHSTSLLTILAVPALVLAVPIFDTCFVTIQRLLHRRHPFVGGTDHVSHRLAVLGLSERQTVIALYGVSVGLGVLGLVTASMRWLTALSVWGVALTGLVLFGGYLAQVNVYRLDNQPPGSPGPLESKPVTRIETMLLHKRRLLEILVDFCLVGSAYVFAHVLRFEGSLSWHLQRLIMQSLPLILGIKLACFAGCGLYRRIWRNPDLSDILTVFKAVTLGSVLSSVALLYGWRFEGYSRAMLVIDWMLLFLAVAGSRVAERLLNEWVGSATEPETTVVIIGAGETGERVLRSLRYNGKATRRVLGFLDDDARKHGTQIHGVRVLGTRARLFEVLEEHEVREVLVAINDPPGDLLQHIQRCCEPRKVSWRVVTAGISGPVA